MNLQANKIISTFILLFITQLTYATTEQKLNSRFQEIIDNYRTANQLPSVTLTVSYPNEQTPRFFTSGTVAYNDQTPVNIGRLFQICSVTKSFIATKVLKLQTQGKLHLDDAISNYLPEHTFWGKVTIRQLLNHTSGIYNFTD